MLAAKNMLKTMLETQPMSPEKITMTTMISAKF